MRWFYVFLVLAASTLLAAQDVVPAGTLLPVALQSTVNSNRAKKGTVIIARVMQDVPTEHGVIRAGSKLVGHVVQVSSNEAGGTSITLRLHDLRASAAVKRTVIRNRRLSGCFLPTLAEHTG